MTIHKNVLSQIVIILNTCICISAWNIPLKLRLYIQLPFYWHNSVFVLLLLVVSSSTRLCIHHICLLDYCIFVFVLDINMHHVILTAFTRSSNFAPYILFMYNISAIKSISQHVHPKSILFSGLHFSIHISDQYTSTALVV